MSNLTRVLCALAMVSSVGSEAAVFNFDVTADLSDPGIYVLDSRYNTTTILLPLVGSPGSAYGSGDTLNVVVNFQGSQRLLLTANPTGQSAPLGEQGVGVFVYDTNLGYNVSGSLDSSLSLIDPVGAYLVNSASAYVSFAAADGAITRLITDWTDTAFSVAGFDFQLQIDGISQPVLPNEIVLEFREFNVQPVPEPATWCLLAAAFGDFGVGRAVYRFCLGKRLQPMGY